MYTYSKHNKYLVRIILYFENENLIYCIYVTIKGDNGSIKLVTQKLSPFQK